MWLYQAMTNVEDDVDSVQAVADVLPKRSDYHYWLCVGPRQVVVVVAWKTLFLNVDNFLAS